MDSLLFWPDHGFLPSWPDCRLINLVTLPSDDPVARPRRLHRFPDGLLPFNHHTANSTTTPQRMCDAPFVTQMSSNWQSTWIKSSHPKTTSFLLDGIDANCEYDRLQSAHTFLNIPQWLGRLHYYSPRPTDKQTDTDPRPYVTSLYLCKADLKKDIRMKNSKHNFIGADEETLEW